MGEVADVREECLGLKGTGESERALSVTTGEPGGLEGEGGLLLGRKMDWFLNAEIISTMGQWSYEPCREAKKSYPISQKTALRVTAN